MIERLRPYFPHFLTAVTCYSITTLILSILDHNNSTLHPELRGKRRHLFCLLSPLTVHLEKVKTVLAVVALAAVYFGFSAPPLAAFSAFAAALIAEPIFDAAHKSQCFPDELIQGRSFRLGAFSPLFKRYWVGGKSFSSEEEARAHFPESEPLFPIPVQLDASFTQYRDKRFLTPLAAWLTYSRYDPIHSELLPEGYVLGGKVVPAEEILSYFNKLSRGSENLVEFTYGDIPAYYVEGTRYLNEEDAVEAFKMANPAWALYEDEYYSSKEALLRRQLLFGNLFPVTTAEETSFYTWKDPSRPFETEEEANKFLNGDSV